ncbi:MAG TPA: polyprenyl synthetase family protein [Thermomicrobiales bacterium]|nr:polyprenyl synthetase family protein [Thermomicrobiales bacterium]
MQHGGDDSGAAALNPVEAEMRRQVATPTLVADAAALADLYGMLRYHLGWADESFAPADAYAGKRLRPLLLIRCAEALGGGADLAAPAAAAVELLHNFTLVHDDVQDESSHRRHRETVWHRWGTAQAINVGDALYAVAHAALYRLAEPPRCVPADRVLEIARGFDEVALHIVEGQFLDLAHEGQWGGGVARYFATIRGKTAAIIAFAARAGALLAGADDATVALFGRYGLALGLAFQIRDDILGIWGAPAVTGKPAADDIRRKKQSLPIVLLDEEADAATREELRALYAVPALDEARVARVLALLDAADIQRRCQGYVTRYHEEARAALDALAPRLARADALYDFLDRLEERAG